MVGSWLIGLHTICVLLVVLDEELPPAPLVPPSEVVVALELFGVAD
jgi:hypothetical protein